MPGTIEYMLYNSIHMEFTEAKIIYDDGNKNSGCILMEQMARKGVHGNLLG